MRDFVDSGVDGIIPGDMRELADIVNGRSDVRLATRDDNPFVTSNEAYELKIKTGDGGTDANITFVLKGALGTAAITVDTDSAGRMEAGATNFVTIPSKDLGALRSITVKNDGSGNRPEWSLKNISVYSGKWLRPDSLYHYNATLNGVVPGGSSRTILFQLDEFVWGGFDGFSDGTASRPEKLFRDAYDEAAPGGTIHLAAGSFSERLTLTKPCTLVFWGDHGANPALIGDRQ